MKNNNEIPKLGKKGTVAGLVLSFVAMITLVGVFTFSQNQDDNNAEQLAENELAENDVLEEASPLNIDTEETNTSEITNEEEKNEEAANGNIITNEEIIAEAEESTLETADATSSEITSTTNASIENQLSFTEDSTMMWPVNGGVIMHFSADQVVYFATLDQYKLNTAMIVDGEVGTEVLAAEVGVVESIIEERETGTTISIDMGNGYTAVYGQLTDVRVTEGSIVEKGQIIGVLAEPTIYYSVEGCNLYFQLLVDGVPVNPFMYMQ